MTNGSQAGVADPTKRDLQPVERVPRGVLRAVGVQSQQVVLVDGGEGRVEGRNQAAAAGGQIHLVDLAAEGDGVDHVEVAVAILVDDRRIRRCRVVELALVDRVAGLDVDHVEEVALDVAQAVLFGLGVHTAGEDRDVHRLQIAVVGVVVGVARAATLLTHQDLADHRLRPGLAQVGGAVAVLVEVEGHAREVVVGHRVVEGPQLHGEGVGAVGGLDHRLVGGVESDTRRRVGIREAVIVLVTRRVVGRAGDPRRIGGVGRAWIDDVRLGDVESEVAALEVIRDGVGFQDVAALAQAADQHGAPFGVVVVVLDRIDVDVLDGHAVVHRVDVISAGDLCVDDRQHAARDVGEQLVAAAVVEDLEAVVGIVVGEGVEHVLAHATVEEVELAVVGRRRQHAPAPGVLAGKVAVAVGIVGQVGEVRGAGDRQRIGVEDISQDVTFTAARELAALDLALELHGNHLDLEGAVDQIVHPVVDIGRP